MTGQKFESELCELMKALGYWALNIPRNQSGAQPFDVIAIHGNKVYAIDCKVCERSSFPLDRVEDNQWAAFEVMHNRTDASVGIMTYHDGDLHFIPFWELCDARELGMKSIKFTKLDMWMSKEDVKSIMGRYME